MISLIKGETENQSCLSNLQTINFTHLELAFKLLQNKSNSHVFHLGCTPLLDNASTLKSGLDQSGSWPSI